MPIRELLAFGVSGLEPAPDASWWEIAQRYPDALVELARSNLGFVRRGEWLSGAYLAGGLMLVFALGRAARDDVAPRLARAAALATVPYLLVVPVFSGLRLELALVPAAAFGFALGAERLERLARARSARSRLAGGGVVRPMPAREPVGSP